MVVLLGTVRGQAKVKHLVVENTATYFNSSGGNTLAHPPSITLDDLQEIMKGLENGNHTLTADDILIVAQVAALINHQSCPFGFQREEVDALKTVLKRGRWVVYIVGLTVITTTVTGFLALSWKIILWLSKIGVLSAASKVGGGH